MWLDYDRDGWLDLAIVNGEIKTLEALARQSDPYPLRQRNQLFRNVPAAGGGRRFEEIDDWAGAESGQIVSGRFVAVREEVWQEGIWTMTGMRKPG